MLKPISLLNITHNKPLYDKVTKLGIPIIQKKKKMTWNQRIFILSKYIELREELFGAKPEKLYLKFHHWYIYVCVCCNV